MRYNILKGRWINVNLETEEGYSSYYNCGKGVICDQVMCVSELEHHIKICPDADEKMREKFGTPGTPSVNTSTNAHSYAPAPSYQSSSSSSYGHDGNSDEDRDVEMGKGKGKGSQQPSAPPVSLMISVVCVKKKNQKSNALSFLSFFKKNREENTLFD